MHKPYGQVFYIDCMRIDVYYFDHPSLKPSGRVLQRPPYPLLPHLTRPEYGSSTSVPENYIDNNTTYGQAQGIYLNKMVLPSLWKIFCERTGATAIVLLSHSIGAMVATISAGSYTGREGYPIGRAYHIRNRH